MTVLYHVFYNIWLPTSVKQSRPTEVRSVVKYWKYDFCETIYEAING